MRTVKSLIKSSCFYKPYRYLTYIFNRYVIVGLFKAVDLDANMHLGEVDSNGISFFGYYNVTPENTNRDVLYLKVNKENVRGSVHEPASIMLKEKNGDIKIIAETRAWNWQQGCMLQWLPGSTDRILFNDYDPSKNVYVTKLIDKKGELIKVYDKPVNNVSKDGKYALTLNYDRLKEIRPDYGYFNRSYSKLPGIQHDGIWRIDLSSGNIELIISLKQLIELDEVPSMKDAVHLVNHIDVNPNGERFMFLHRWIGSEGRLMRMITANSDGTVLRILNGDVMTSHCCWLNDTEIMSYCNYKGKVGYFKFIDDVSEPAQQLKNMPTVDGHPSASPDGKWLITDTYPDKSRFSSLYIYDLKKQELHLKGKFFQSLNYTKEIRIDLHPKWGFSSNAVFFESGHEGCRKLYKAKLIKE